MTAKPKLTDLRHLSRYLDTIEVETDGEPRVFNEVADDWQVKDIEAVRPALTRLVNPRARKPAVQRAMWVRPRAHAKTADAAMLVAWVLAFSGRRRRAVWVAADQQQGCEGLDSIQTLCRHNRWLASLLTIRKDKAENERTGSVCYFTTSDVSSAYGWKDCDLFIFDELTHWPDHKEPLWSAMYSAAGKRSGAAVFALMNAGFAGGWQESLRDTAAADPNWAFSELPDAVASWVSEEQLADQLKYLPAVAYDRLWRNRWSSSGGDALRAEDVERAFDAKLGPMTGRERGWLFVTGVDLSISRDFTSVVTLAVPDASRQSHHERIRLADARLWIAPADGKINYLEVERYILGLDARFGLENVVIEQYQGERLAQGLELDTQHKRRNEKRQWWSQPWVRVIHPSSATLRTQATVVVESFVDGRLRLYEYEPLKRDLQNLRVEQKTSAATGIASFRMVSPRSKATGHGDTYSAFALALQVGHELAANLPAVAGVGFGPAAEHSDRSDYPKPWWALHNEWLQEQGRLMLEEEADPTGCFNVPDGPPVVVQSPYLPPPYFF
jgi:hypothetical protein